MADTLLLWIGAAAMFGTQILVAATLVGALRARFAGSPLVDEVTMLGLALTYLLGFVAVAFVHRSHGWRELHVIGLSRPVSGRDVALAFTAALVAIPITNAALGLTQWMWQALNYTHESAHQLLQMMERSQQSPWVVVLTILVATVLAPVFEEILFRGHVQTAIAAKLPSFTLLPNFITSLIFAAVHEPWTMPPIFVLSLMLGWVYERTGSLWVPILLHVAFNALSTAVFLFVRPTL